MAAAACTYSEETESFVTCSICLCEFDAETRKPKFLPCAHTLCLKCLKEIHKEFVISCPLCRKEFSHQDDVSSLPNNSYALHMLKFSEKSPETPASKPDSTNGKPTWCLTCGALAKQGCSVHSIIDVTAKTIKNFESLLKLRDDIKKMRDQGQTKLALAIEKRKEVQTHLDQLSQCLKLVLHEVNLQEETNNILLVEMISELEASSPCLHQPLNPEIPQDEDPLLSELISLVDDSNPQDSFDTLKEKMKKSLLSCESKLADAVAVAKTLQYQKKSKISVWLTDPRNQTIPTFDWLEKGFTTYWPSDTNLSPTKRDFLLLSHIVFSIQKRGAKLNKQTTSDVTADEPPDHNLSVTKKFEETSPSVTTTNPSSVISLNSPIEKFDLNKATLIMTVRRHGTFKGSVHIKLSPSCNSQFIQKLGKICFRTPKQFSNLIEKTVPGVFLLVPAFEDMADFSYDDLSSLPLTRHYMEAGISLWVDEYGDLGGWNLVFPLQYFENKRNDMHLKTIQPVYFIGQVTQGIEAIEALSWTTKYQRSGYTFTLESR
ncbi:uncharacterized protein LOC124196810 [Daphnia pulex]|uniref:uncharacterized protein LOC124196810 n=1 Tax=Daphnia pulex TaxID=6669 RepID=UPI001EE0F64B|nr:uncharacterized protein LOC124196810 [Daphnia pulex]